MSNKPCVPKPLVMSEYCRLFICPDCVTVHLILPCRLSMQLDLSQFLAIADAFTQAAKKLRRRMPRSSGPDTNVVEFDRRH